jgi:hypothetical protein
MKINAANGFAQIETSPFVHSCELANALDPLEECATLTPPIFALIVYRLGQEILNLQSGVRFPVGAPSS